MPLVIVAGGLRLRALNKQPAEFPGSGIGPPPPTTGWNCMLDGPIPLGAEVHWQSPKREFRGRVRYCVYREIGYFAGVEFRRSSKWSRKDFKPQHLLDLEQLMAHAKR